jgi:hypothetical protein
MARCSEYHGSIQVDKWGRRDRAGHLILLEDALVLAVRDQLAIEGSAVGALQAFEKKTA